MQRELDKNVAQLDDLRRENKITKEEYERRLEETNKQSQDAMKNMEDEIAKLRKQAMENRNKGGFFSRIGAALDSLF